MRDKRILMAFICGMIAGAIACAIPMSMKIHMYKDSLNRVITIACCLSQRLSEMGIDDALAPLAR